jgi:DnaJ-class molecular chaperone
MCNEAVADDSPAQCKECYGKGWNDEWKASGHYSGGEVFRIECSACEGAGVKA